MKAEQITSAQNPKIKNLLQLQEKSKARKQQGLFVVEGVREFTHCLEGQYKPESVFFCEKHMTEKEVSDILGEEGCRVHLYNVSEQVYEKIAYRGTTEGLVATVHIREKRLEDLELPENPLLLVLESVEKPGNLGAIIRSAEAAGADAVIICDPLTDIYNPNLIRASIGGIFTTQTAVSSSTEVIKWLKEHKISIITAQLQDSRLYYDTDMTKGTAIVVGAEDKGLSQEWRLASDAKIRIPMAGKLDSLNVSVSAAILCYEAIRQRHSSARAK